jgi:rhamnogalacturonan endolyase
MMKVLKGSALFIAKLMSEEVVYDKSFQSGVQLMIKTLFLIIFIFTAFISNSLGQYQIEELDRGIVAVSTSDTSVFISWRMLATDPDSISFNVYRDDTKINDTLVVNSTNFVDVYGSNSDTYHVIPVSGGVEQVGSDTVHPWTQKYLAIPLQIPAGGTAPGSSTYTYNANDCSTGDLDGDGEYEIVLKWDPSNSKDNSQSGYTGNAILDAYKFDGTRLWRIDLGINIRAGAHYTQFMVYDLDGDGKSEVACKTAPGTKDASGNFLKLGPAASADHAADYRNTSGYILSGPEYFTLFNGETGNEIATVDYIPPRGNLASWGDTYGNRVDRFLACIAYLDGIRPSVVMCRGYYTGNGRGRTVLAAWDYRDDTLTHRWTFNADLVGENAAYTAQGNHNLSVGDVDNDGKDEIVYGSCAIDDDGTGLWNSGLGHGDAMHLSDIDPNRPGLEVWGIHESAAVGSALLDAKTGEIIWGTGPGDVGRGVAADLVASLPGMECWGGTDGLRSAKNKRVGNAPGSSNHVIWWDGDLTRELLNDNYIDKYGKSIIFTANGCASINGTKSNPNLQADILGDWREEVVFRTTNNSELRIFTTTDTTSYRLTTLMHDHIYRMGIAWQNVAYNQPPHTGFYLSPDIFLPDSLRPPSAPFNLTALALNDTVKLQWNKNVEADLAGYNLYRSEVTEGNLIKLNIEWLVDNNYVDSVVINDTTYYYAVTAVDTLNNESRFSDIIQAIPTLRPDAPTGLYARNDVQKIKLFWDPVLTGTITGYNVYRAKTPGKSYIKINTELIAETTNLNAPLTNGVIYYYVVTSVDDKAIESFHSDEVSSAAGPVTYLQEDAGIVSGGSIDNNNLGFNGNGFYNFASNSSYIDFINIGGHTGGNYMLVYRYALGNTNRTGSLIVNNVSQNLTMKNTASWTTYLYDSVLISLNSDFTNTIRFASTGSDFGNLDEITVKPSTLSNVFDRPAKEPAEFSGIYPNPFSDQTRIKYYINEPYAVTVQILNITGQPVRTLVNAMHEPGSYEITWDASDVSGKRVPEGIYFCRLVINNKGYDIQKLILIGK